MYIHVVEFFQHTSVTLDQVPNYELKFYLLSIAKKNCTLAFSLSFYTFLFIIISALLRSPVSELSK